MGNFKPGYQQLMEKNLLKEKVQEALKSLEACDICPHECGVNRLENEKGFCRTGRDMLVASYSPHFGEERPLVGARGSGTIFFSFCNLRCVYCQNYDISTGLYGKKTSKENLADMMMELQDMGCHNINLVTPTHLVPQILESLEIAAEEGLNLPVVYNCGGYESLKTLRLLEGIIDIYMPDFKYTNKETAKKYSGIDNYPDIAKKALKEMHRQVGDLVTDDLGIALRGLLIRHLVLPHDLAGTEEAMRFIGEEISPDSFVNVMAQYHPAYKAHDYPELSRRLYMREYEDALEIAQKFGIIPSRKL